MIDINLKLDRMPARSPLPIAALPYVMSFLIIIRGSAIAAILASLLIPQVHAQTQAAMNAQARSEFVQAAAELNRTYEALLTKLPDAEGKEKLKKAQRAWLAFRDAEAAFVAQSPNNRTLTTAVGSSHEVPVDRPDVVIDQVKDMLKKI